MGRLSKMIASGLAVMLIGGVLVLGPGKLLTMFRAAVNRAEQRIDEGTSDEQLVAVVKTKLGDIQADIDRGHAAVAKIRLKSAAEKKTIDNLARSLAAEEGLLRRGGELLAQGHTTYEIAGKAVTRDDLEADAAARLRRCEGLRQKIRSKEKIRQSLLDGIVECEVRLREAENAKGELEARLADLETRRITAGIRKELAELTSAASIVPDGEIARAVELLEDRTRADEIRADRMMETTKSPGTIEWEAPSTTERIRRYLENK